MEHLGLRVRPARVSDAPELLSIYAPYVERTAITFEYEVPTVEEFASRISCTLERHPYLVAERVESSPDAAGAGGSSARETDPNSDRIVGYAYVGPFHARAAYDWSVETSVYVRMDGRRQGVGRLLYEKLELVTAAMGITNLEACIAYPNAEPDEYLTTDSVRFHERMGYRMVGRFDRCAYKFGRWYDMVWMEKHVGTHREEQPPVRPFAQVMGLLEG